MTDHACTSGVRTTEGDHVIRLQGMTALAWPSPMANDGCARRIAHAVRPSPETSVGRVDPHVSGPRRHVVVRRFGQARLITEAQAQKRSRQGRRSRRLPLSARVAPDHARRRGTPRRDAGRSAATNAGPSITSTSSSRPQRAWRLSESSADDRVEVIAAGWWNADVEMNLHDPGLIGASVVPEKALTEDGGTMPFHRRGGLDAVRPRAR